MAETLICNGLEKGSTPQGIIALCDDEHRYNAQNHYGEHGGATLAELVVPTIVIAADDYTKQKAEKLHPMLEDRPARAPMWWNLELISVVPRALPGKVSGSKAASAKASSAQLVLHDMGLAEAPKAPEPAPASVGPADGGEFEVSAQTKKRMQKLAAHELFKARATQERKRKQTLSALKLLLEHDNGVSAQLFAQVLGQPSYRVAGLVSQMGEILNFDGYEVISFNPVSRRVELNEQLLCQGYSLS